MMKKSNSLYLNTLKGRSNPEIMDVRTVIKMFKELKTEVAYVKAKVGRTDQDLTC